MIGLAARGRPVRGYAVGITGYAAGLLASALFDLPSGAAIVLGLVVAALGAALFTARLRRSY